MTSLLHSQVKHPVLNEDWDIASANMRLTYKTYEIRTDPDDRPTKHVRS